MSPLGAASAVSVWPQRGPGASPVTGNGRGTGASGTTAAALSALADAVGVTEGALAAAPPGGLPPPLTILADNTFPDTALK